MCGFTSLCIITKKESLCLSANINVWGFKAHHKSFLMSITISLQQINDYASIYKISDKRQVFGFKILLLLYEYVAEVFASAQLCKNVYFSKWLNVYFKTGQKQNYYFRNIHLIYNVNSFHFDHHINFKNVPLFKNFLSLLVPVSAV